MFLDARGFAAGHVERARVCIAGSGPAGMTLAHALARRGVEVLLLEAGGLELEDGSQALYAGQVVGDPYYELDYARLRYLGGTSGHWAGYCRPLDPHDFEPHPDFPHTGWPIGRAALDPYLAPAAEILEIPADFPDRPVSSELVRTFFHISPPVRFGEKYRAWCETAPGVRVCLHSALTGLVPGGSGIRAAEVTTEGPEGAQASWRVEADLFVLAMGGIENSRLLLWANERNGGALLPNPDILGRYWMDHPTVSVAEALIWPDRAGLFEDGQAYFALSGAQLRRIGALAVSFDADGEAYPDETRALIADLLCTAPRLGQSVLEAFGKNLVCGTRLHAQWEQAPDPENRVALGTERDRLGIPRPVLHWRRTEADRRTITTATKAVAQAFAAQDIGRVRLLDWITDDSLPIPVDRVMASWHHMGGTRMSETPATGVVDPELKVHGLDNLYVAGSSVFPTGGYANPTLSIVQLSLRLADHLAARMAG